MQLSKSIFDFLSELTENNNKPWFEANKKRYQEEEAKLKVFLGSVLENLEKTDNIEKMKIYRIYRDVRFSKDKTPYKVHRSVNFSRATEELRGGYYLRIAPGASILGGGFFSPNPKDLMRIRKEFETDATELREILADQNFQEIFGELQGDRVKTAPRGFDKNHENIDLIQMKSFIAMRSFTDAEVLAPDFINKINKSFLALRPFFNYMSDVLTTDLNGESIL